jgi:glycine betaine catabolism A
MKTDAISATVAPLPPEDLGAVLTGEFGDARTLPASAYRSEHVLAWERHHFFDEAWVCIGRADLVPDPKSQRAIRLSGEGIVLARDEDGELRAFFNSCRHRGHELLADGECRQRGTIACPYHSWTYNLDGSLRRATRFSDVQGFDPADFPLQPVAVRQWNGWIFANLSGDAPPLQTSLGNLDEHLEDWRIGRLKVAATHEYVVHADWKLIVENYLECYHCPSIHPELCRVSPPDSGHALEQTGLWLGGPMDLRGGADTMSLDGASPIPRLTALTDEQARQVFYFALFPNLLISPHPDYVMTHRLDPISPTTTWVECAWLFASDAADRQGFDPSYATAFWDIMNRQDFTACEAVQRGLGSRGYLPGPFDFLEFDVYAFQAMLAQAYRSGEVRQPRGWASVMG